MVDSELIRILIVDDHAMVRSGLRNFLYGFDWMTMVGEAANGEEAVAFCVSNDVDVVLMDIMMPIMDGTEATRRITALGKQIRIIILTSFHEQDQVEQALKAGATSYLLKNVSAEELSKAIRAAYEGYSTLSPEATQALIQSDRHKQTSELELTDREQEVLGLLVQGLTNQEISKAMSISTATVKYHLTSLFAKLGAKNRVEAVTNSIELGLIKMPQ